jgi:TolB-like protein/Tfp pilus assembly protein PilF
MELLEGRTLDQLIPAGGVSFALFFDVAMALADALSAAHQKQITHRDLKPANVMVTEAGRVKVLDFGLARAAAPQAKMEVDLTRGLTQVGSILGTMPYMSPEQIEARPVDGRSDIFSLGIVMYEMATGRRPFHGETSPALMSSILKDRPIPLSDRRPDAPDGIAPLIARCLEKDLRYRVQTAHEILVELRALRRAWESGTSSSRSIRLGTARTADELLRIAVLPFAPRPASGDADALADGLTDDITAGLARFPILRVVSRQDAQRASGQEATSGVASALAARYLLEGTVRAAGDRFRVTARLVDSSTGTHLWAETFEKTMSDGLFALQDDVANRIIASVADSNGALVRSMVASLRDKPLEDHSPFELVIRYESYNQRHNRDEHAPLRDALEASLAKHPGDAEAWACLGGLIVAEPLRGYNQRPDSMGRAREAIRRALEIDSTCQRAWLISGLISFMARDAAGVRIAIQRILNSNPLDTSKLATASVLLVATGDRDRARELAQTAVSYHANVAPWYRITLFSLHYLAGEYAEAFDEAKRGYLETFRHSALALAVAAGKVGSAVDARTALAALTADGFGTSLERAREEWSRWYWDPRDVDHMVEGFEAALALDGRSRMEREAPAAPTAPDSGRKVRAPESRTDRSHAVSVKPFAAASADDDTTSLAQGLSEDIGTGLSRFQHIQLRADGDARYVVEGSVRRSGVSVRASVKVVDTDSGIQLWAEHYDRKLGATGIFDLQDEITARVVATLSGLGGVLVDAMGAPVRDRPIDELGPNDLVLRTFYYLRGPTADEHAHLRAALERTVAAYPRHAPAWAALGVVYDHERWLGMNPLPDSAARTANAARRAIEADPASQHGWQRLVAVHYHSGDWNAMRSAADRMIALNPLNFSAIGFVGMMLAVSGDWTRGIPMVRRAVEFDPHHPGLIHIALFLDHYREREYEQALAETKRMNASQAPTTVLAYAAAAGQLGRVEEARSALEMLKRDGGEPTREAARERWSIWLRDSDLLERLLDGLEKARTLVESRVETGATPTGSGSGRHASIAVLPFTDMSAEHDQEWFCDGMAEEVLNALSQVKGLTVAARASAFSFRGKGDDLHAIGEKLHVTTVLDGSVRRSGDQVRITVRLSDVANGYQIWSERYDRSIKDIFDVQDEIAKTIAERLRVSLGGDPASVPHVVRHTDNQEAYHLYLRGRHHWYARTRGGLKKALANFEEAARLDPNYALTYVGMSELYTAQAIYGFEPEEQLGVKARAAVQRALALNDRLGDAHRANGFSLMFFDWDEPAGVRALQKAVELDPASGLSWGWLGWPAWPGRRDQALAAVTRAQDLDPLNPYVHALSGLVHDVWVSPEAGIAQGMKAIDIDPNYLVALYLTGGCYTHAGRHDEALALFGKAVEISERASFYVAYLAWAQAMAGRTDDARKGLAELEARAIHEYVSPVHMAMVLGALGDLDRGFAVLEDAVRARAAWIGSPRMPMFDGFRGDPRFNALLRRLGHPDAAQTNLRA